MKDCILLGKVTQTLIPEYYSDIDWNNIWKRNLENGTGFEWATLAAIINYSKDNGFSVDIPLLSQFSAGDYFLLRNEMPLTHGAQVGNSSTLLHNKPLSERFFYSLVPKVVLSKNNISYSIFREGCPIHKIMCGENYIDRTDIIVFPGKMVEGYPKLNSSGNEVLFEYEYNKEILSGTIRIMSSPYIPCKKRAPRGGMKMLPTGIIECSINKSQEVADTQLKKYSNIFNVDQNIPPFCLITGNDLSMLPYPNSCVNLKTETEISLKNELVLAASTAMSSFGLL
jgi:hypothetical protein